MRNLLVATVTRGTSTSSIVLGEAVINKEDAWNLAQVSIAVRSRGAFGYGVVMTRNLQLS